MNTTFRTSESVTEGHPDKLADRISDAVLDAALTEDTKAHVACETFITTGLVLVGGEITTRGYVDIDSIARQAIKEVGYDRPSYSFNHQDCAVLSAIQEQSSDIAAAVDKKQTNDNADPFDTIGAGDQGIMYGYACNTTSELMPLPITLAHRLTQQLAKVRKEGIISYLRPDGKSQVTVEYEGRKPVRVSTALIAAQHDPGVERYTLQQDIQQHVIQPILENWIDNKTEMLVNSSGRFVIGGPKSDTGMTGRKIIVDTYGGFCPHGGGAFSGKDPTKVDRSGAYMARYVAKNIVAAGIAQQAEVQLAYAIGRAAPLAVSVDTFRTGNVSDKILRTAVLKVFDFRPGAIIDNLNLLRPMYESFSCYGHFGRSDLSASWEETNRIKELKQAL